LASSIVIHQLSQILPSSETQTQTDAMQLSSREPPPPRTPPRTPEEGAELEAEQESLPDSEQEQDAGEEEEELPRKICGLSQWASMASMVASAGETDRDLAGTQFPRNCVPYNIIEFKHYNFKNI
jgi:hypothetical protein